MAEVTAFRNNALPYPVYGVGYTVVFPILDADGDPVTGATCDSEVSKNGDTGADCTNEGTEITYTTATNKGIYYLTLTAAEMTADIVAVTVYPDSGKTTPIVLYPRKLVTLRSGTSQGGAAGYITLDALAGKKNDKWNGCLCVGTLDATYVEARLIDDYDGTNQQASVTPDWVTTPDADDTFVIYLPEGMQIPTADVVSVAEIPISIAIATGNWNAGATWSSGAVPVAGDNIIVRTGVTLTVSANLDLGTFGTLQLQGSARLVIGAVTVAVLPAGWTVSTNNGTITTSNGTVVTNAGTITGNFGVVKDNEGTITANDTSGIVTLNSTGTVTDNAGLIVTNYVLGTITDNKTGIITWNNGEVTTNGAIVVNNDGEVTTNTGMVIHNRGGTVTNDTGDTGIMQSGDNYALWKVGGTLDVLLKDVPSTAEFNARTVVTADYFLVSDYTVPLDAAGIRTAVGLASANLDTQLGAIPTVTEFNARTVVSADYFLVSDYTAPDNTGIAAIEDVTDKLGSAAMVEEVA